MGFCSSILTTTLFYQINSRKDTSAVEVIYNGAADVDEDTDDNSDSELRRKLVICLLKIVFAAILL